VTGIDDLLSLLRDDLGLPVDEGEDGSLRLDAIAGWDSVHLLWLVTALEERTGSRLSLPDLLDAVTVADVHRLATAGPGAQDAAAADAR
jgi:acyl carrier protein